MAAAAMRLATYNVEWFSALFDSQDRLMLDGAKSGRHGIDRYTQGHALGRVFQRLDADAVMVIEAPNSGRTQRSTRALEAFAAEAGLRAREAVSGFANDTQQEISLLFDPDVLDAEHEPRMDPGAPRFDRELEIDLDQDGQSERVQFSKPPLELAVTTRDGARLRLIGAHLKSKYPHGARSKDEMIRVAISNRRKQLAQAVWLRRRIDAHLAAGDHLIVMGDLNDGPGLDEYERLFGRSTVEIVLGSDLSDPHARSLLQPRQQVFPSSARFYNPARRRYFRALLDYVMISPGLQAFAPAWRIWHPFEDAACYEDEALREALLAASDHFPVSLDIGLT